ncbi:MAG: peptidylprolyl isomerase, partial [Treponema sp.]|nr:peptidylprolyl isomerase [Treponema sp.]
KVVSIDYTLTGPDNNVLDSTSGQEPLNYLHGFGNIIPGLEKALEGKNLGDRFSVTIPAAEAYGEYEKRLITEIPRENFEDAGLLEAGMKFQAHTSGGIRIFTILAVGDNTITVDGNHELAGMDLNFDITVAAVRDASEEELRCGHLHEHCCGKHENCEEDHSAGCCENRCEH